LGGTSSQFVKGDGSLDSNVYALNSALANYQLTSEKAQPNGYASLDSNGKVPLVQINDALIGNVNFQGLWNASTNTPTLANPPASGTKGYYYIVSTAGTFASISFEVGDWIISDGTAWGKVDNTDAVSSVFGRTGNVTASNGDYNTSQVTENTNLYFTNARAIASVLTGYSSGAGTISAADSILSAIQKLNGNIGGLVTGVSSVNGQTGVVVLTTTNIAEGTNLYYTDARSRAALSFVAGSGAYNSTTGVITIPTNNNQITNGAGYITSAALGAYLPLAGGTLTGALNGTSAAFSGGAIFYNGGNSFEFAPNVLTSSNASGAHIRNVVSAADVPTYSFAGDQDTGMFSSAANVLGFSTGGVQRLSIASTGAATFSSSVRANAASTIYGATQDAIQTILTLGGQNASAQAKELYFRLAAGGTPAWTLQTASVGTDTDVNIYPNGASGLKIAFGGAATFSSSVTALGEQILLSNAGTPNLQLRKSGITDWGNIQYDGSKVTIGTFAGGQTLNVTTGGNVGIGTASPAARLDVGDGNIHISNSSSSSSSVREIYNYINPSTSSSVSNGIDIGFRRNTTFPNRGAAIKMFQSGTSDGSGDANTNISFWTYGIGVDNGAERMRITSGGSVWMGTQTDTYSRGARLDVNGNETMVVRGYGSGFGIGIFMVPNSSASGTHQAIAFRSPSNTDVGTITTTSSATNYNTTSDYRLKENLEDVKGLEKVQSIKVYNYKWKAEESRMDGVLAHELAEVLPYAVHGEKDAVDEEGKEIMQGVDYSKIVPVLIKAIQELKTEIDSLKNQIK
jgi:hypothetical protein